MLKFKRKYFEIPKFKISLPPSKRQKMNSDDQAVQTADKLSIEFPVHDQRNFSNYSKGEAMVNFPRYLALKTSEIGSQDEDHKVKKIVNSRPPPFKWGNLEKTLGPTIAGYAKTAHMDSSDSLNNNVPRRYPWPQSQVQEEISENQQDEDSSFDLSSTIDEDPDDSDSDNSLFDNFNGPFPQLVRMNIPLTSVRNGDVRTIHGLEVLVEIHQPQNITTAFPQDDRQLFEEVNRDVAWTAGWPAEE